MGVREKDPLAQLSLPPGFRFHPTDEELLVKYLCRKVAGYHFSLQVIGDIDLYKFDPWDLPSKALFGEKEWYFFTPRDRKYPNGSRPNRVAGSGYWKATGTDKNITADGRRVGIKKALVFYAGKAPKGNKTNWIMHEYRLIEHSRSHGSSKLDDWVLCRIYEKKSGSKRQDVSPAQACREEQSTNGSTSSSSSSHVEDVLDSFPEMKDRSFNLPRMNSLRTILNGNFDWASLACLNPIPEAAQSNVLPNYGGYDAIGAVESGFRNPKVDPEQNSGGLGQSFGYGSSGSDSGFGHSGQILEFKQWS
ncbi:unnamed protein product [Cochlearia groenlandica]